MTPLVAVGAVLILFGPGVFATDIECVQVNTTRGMKWINRNESVPYEGPLYMWNCEGSMPVRRTQSYKRPKVCVPGQRPNTCIIAVFDEPKSLARAAETCLYEYGGRLAVAHDEESTALWIRTIWRNTEYSSAKPSKFWIGALVGENGRGGNFFTVKEARAFRLLPPKPWDYCFWGEKPLWRDLWPLANKLPKRAFKNANTCPTWGVVLDVSPGDGRWHVEDASANHGFLCEAPRWPRLDCGSGWALIPSIYLCFRALRVNVKRDKCDELCSAVGGKKASFNAFNHWYFKETTEPIFNAPGTNVTLFHFGMHVETTKSKGGIYHVANLDGSKSGFVTPYRHSKAGMICQKARCNSYGNVDNTHIDDRDSYGGCLCQKMVDISGADVQRSTL